MVGPREVPERPTLLPAGALIIPSTIARRIDCRVAAPPDPGFAIGAIAALLLPLQVLDSLAQGSLSDLRLDAVVDVGKRVVRPMGDEPLGRLHRQ